MAKTLIAIETCDLCKHLGLPTAEAERSVQLAIDGPPKRFELCPPHVVQLGPFIELYQDEDYGVDESLKPKKRATIKRDAEPEGTGTFPIPTQAPRQLEMAQPEPAPQGPTEEKKTKKPASKKKDLWLVCPLPHTSKKGEPMRVRYENRGTHANMVHELQTWDIDWQDPDGILTVQCDAHAECRKTGLGFTSAMGLKQHIAAHAQEKLEDQNAVEIDDLANIA